MFLTKKKYKKKELFHNDCETYQGRRERKERRRVKERGESEGKKAGKSSLFKKRLK
jgi:hypothetical protein